MKKNRKAEHNTRLFCIFFGVIEKYSLSEEQLVAKLMEVENTTPTITSSRVAKAICEIKPSELNITNWIESVFEKETKNHVTRNNIQP